jgi:hypothetical protein
VARLKAKDWFVRIVSILLAASFLGGVLIVLFYQ